MPFSLLVFTFPAFATGEHRPPTFRLHSLSFRSRYKMQPPHTATSPITLRHYDTLISHYTHRPIILPRAILLSHFLATRAHDLSPSRSVHRTRNPNSDCTSSHQTLRWKTYSDCDRDTTNPHHPRTLSQPVTLVAKLQLLEPVYHHVFALLLTKLGYDLKINARVVPNHFLTLQRSNY